MAKLLLPALLACNAARLYRPCLSFSMLRVIMSSVVSSTDVTVLESALSATRPGKGTPNGGWAIDRGGRGGTGGAGRKGLGSSTDVCDDFASSSDGGDRARCAGVGSSSGGGNGDEEESGGEG